VTSSPKTRLEAEARAWRCLSIGGQYGVRCNGRPIPNINGPLVLGGFVPRCAVAQSSRACIRGHFLLSKRDPDQPQRYLQRPALSATARLTNGTCPRNPESAYLDLHVVGGLHTAFERSRHGGSERPHKSLATHIWEQSRTLGYETIDIVGHDIAANLP
jgi:hypothetical protein